MRLRWWAVITPEYKRYPASMFEPAEYGRDVVEVEARTRRDAVILGVREMLRNGEKYCLEARGDGVSPFTGVKAWTLKELNQGLLVEN